MENEKMISEEAAQLNEDMKLTELMKLDACKEISLYVDFMRNFLKIFGDEIDKEHGCHLFDDVVKQLSAYLFERAEADSDFDDTMKKIMEVSFELIQIIFPAVVQKIMKKMLIIVHDKLNESITKLVELRK